MERSKKGPPVSRETFPCGNGQFGFRTGVFNDYKRYPNRVSHWFALTVTNEAGPNGILHRSQPLAERQGSERYLFRDEYAVVEAHNPRTGETYWYAARDIRTNERHETVFCNFADPEDLESVLCSSLEEALERQEVLVWGGSGYQKKEGERSRRASTKAEQAITPPSEKPNGRQWLLDAYARGERDFREADLEGGDLKGLSLEGTDLRKARLRHADLKGTNLLAADLRGADLRHADLRNAVLEDSDLRKADLLEAILRGANLRRADLRRAKLKNARLAGADLTGAFRK